MTRTRHGAEQRVVLENISWGTYLAITEEAQGRGVRMAYDQGVLEIMSPSLPHERIATLIGRMIEALTEELGIEMLSVRSTTFKREDMHRGFEADECYYLAHAAAMRGKEAIDLLVDPPPDLAVEVDISRSSIGKLSIYASLGIPEVWRYEGSDLRAFVRQPDGTYLESKHSTVLPQLSPAVVVGFLEQRDALDETQLIRSFRTWVRERFTPGQ